MTVRRVPSQYATIAAAIADSQPGDTILVACGFYVIDTTLTIPVGLARLRIEGESPNCTILQGPGSEVGILVQADAVTIRRLTLRNFDTAIEVRGQRDVVRDNRVLSCEVGIELTTGSERTLVMNNTLTDTSEAIIVATPQHYIIGNRITNATTTGIAVRDQCNNVLIAENRIISTGVNGILIESTDAEDPTSGCWITNNVVQGSGGDGLNLAGDLHYVHGNNFSKNQGHGIDITGGGDHIVLYNECHENRGSDDTDGISNMGTTSLFYKNEMKDNRDNGVQESMGFNMYVANTAKGNRNNGMLIGDNGNQIIGNRVERNSVGGIRLMSGVSNTTVEDNRAFKNRGDGGIVLTATPIATTVVRFNRACGNKQFDINVDPANFGNDNRIELNRCDRSNPSQLCERRC